MRKCRLTSLGLRVVRYRAIRCGRMLRSAQEHPQLLGHPDGSHQKIDRTLEECRMITLDAMTQEKKNPTPEEEQSSPDPLGEDQENDAGKNQGNADAVQHLVPDRRMLVIILSHVARETGHIGTPSVGTLPAELHFITKRRKWLERRGVEKLSKSYKSRRPSMAFSIVTSSAYSRSAPTGMPTPILVTRTPSGFNSLERYMAVASPSAVGFVAMMISSTDPSFRRSPRDLFFRCSGPRPSSGQSRP